MHSRKRCDPDTVPLPAARTEFVRIADGVPAASERDSSSGSKEDERDLRVDHDSFE